MIISSYIWQGRHPHLNKVHLKKTKAAGGLALPNFRFYHWAANLSCLAFWSFFYSQPDCPDWVAMEDLFINDTLASFEQLRKKFSPSKSNFFRYLQARHSVLSQLSGSPTSADRTIVDTVLSLSQPSMAWCRTSGVRPWTSSEQHGRACMHPEVSPFCDKCRSAEASLTHTGHALASSIGLRSFTLSQVLNFKLEPTPLVTVWCHWRGDAVTCRNITYSVLRFPSGSVSNPVQVEGRCPVHSHDGWRTSCPN